MQDAWRAYLELALGLTEASRKKAQQIAQDIFGKGEATAGQVQSFVDELLFTSRANREGLARLVRYEVDRALGVVGLATAEEVTDLTNRVRELERRVRDLQDGTATAEPTAAPAPAAAQPPAKKTVAKKTVAKKAAKKTVAKQAVAKQPGAKKSAAARVSDRKAARTSVKKAP